MRPRQLRPPCPTAVTSLTITSAVHASSDDPVSATDIVQYGWNIKDWKYFGNALSSWADGEPDVRSTT
jgi:hypothetical protein